MTIKDLLEYANKHEIELTSAIFENYGSIDKRTAWALLQEMSALLTGKDVQLIDNLKEYHEELFEEDEE